MEEDLISKKDLLELTGISYGQLYRWKRKGLIPDEWFIRKSTFTGQETFFPKTRVLQRINRIKDMKEDVSLDDLVDVFTPTLNKTELTIEQAAERKIASADVSKIYLELSRSREPLQFNDILCLYIFDKALGSGDIGLEESKTVLQVLRAGQGLFNGQPCELFLTRKLGVFQCFAVSPPASVCLDEGVHLIARMNTAALIEELKMKLM
jgi:hypothetical protein